MVQGLIALVLADSRVGGAAARRAGGFQELQDRSRPLPAGGANVFA